MPWKINFLCSIKETTTHSCCLPINICKGSFFFCGKNKGLHLNYVFGCLPKTASVICRKCLLIFVENDLSPPYSGNREVIPFAPLSVLYYINLIISSRKILDNGNNRLQVSHVYRRGTQMTRHKIRFHNKSIKSMRENCCLQCYFVYNYKKNTT